MKKKRPKRQSKKDISPKPQTPQLAPTKSDVKAFDRNSTDDNADKIENNKLMNCQQNGMSTFEIWSLAILIATFVFTTIISFGSLYYSRQAVGEVRKQFEISNKPFLTLLTYDVVFKMNTPVFVNVTTGNLGNYPVVIVNTRFQVMISATEPDFAKELEKTKKAEGSWFVAKDIPHSDTKTFNIIPIQPAFYQDVVDRKTKFYLYGEIEYRDQITGQLWKYLYAVRVVNPQSDYIPNGPRALEYIKSINCPSPYKDCGW